MPPTIDTTATFGPQTGHGSRVATLDRSTRDGKGLMPIRVAMMAAGSLAIIFVNRVPVIGPYLSFASILALEMIGSPGQALAGAHIGVLALCTNTAFVPKVVAWTVFRFINLFTFTGRFTLFGGSAPAVMGSGVYLTLSAFVAAAAVCSLLSGYYVHIAILKLFFFWVGMTGVFHCIGTIRSKRIDVTEWFVSQTLTLGIMSYVALVTGVGSNFSGIVDRTGLYNLGLFHSQTMGPVASLQILYLACVYLFTGHRNRWLCIPIALWLLYCLYLTGSRTGVGVLAAGSLVLVASALGRRRWAARTARVNLSRSSIALILVVLTVLIGLYDAWSGGGITRAGRAFIAKKGSEVDTVSLEETLASRQFKVQQSYENFLESPVYGIGFQVSKDQYFIDNATLFYAPVEKGFLPTAVLEEVGVLGSFFFVLFILSIVISLLRDRNTPGLVMFTAILVCNLGEASFFALAGQGAYNWFFFIGSVCLGDHCTFVTPGARRGRMDGGLTRLTP